MRLAELIDGLPISGPIDADLEVGGVTHDSRRVVAGDLFVALAGERFDGRAFVPQAVERGAVAILAAGPLPEGAAATWLSADEPRRLLGHLAARLHAHPDRELLTIGVTGTNGKSSVVELLAAVLEAAGRPAGRLGTLGYRFDGKGFAAGDLNGLRTTPEASDLFATLRRMRSAGAEAVVMEVSSHALELHRVAGARFDVGVFLNLSRDHFDFHSDFEDYFAAKRRLFDHLKRHGRPVVNVSDPYGRRLASELPRALTFGAGGAVTTRAVELDAKGIRGTMVTPRGDYPFATSLLGEFNLENVTAAAAAAEALGLPHDAVARGLGACLPLPGRLEPVAADLPFGVYIDFAHTDAALAAAVGALKGFSGHKVILVFGCGGDRDPGKREMMGRAAGSLAELPIVTTDNPRGEDPLEIIAAVEEGLRQSGNDSYRIIPDRREAIRKAIANATPGWSVLIAGKGHEEVQVVGEEKRPFSDRDEVRRALEERFGARTGG